MADRDNGDTRQQTRGLACLLYPSCSLKRLRWCARNIPSDQIVSEVSAIGIFLMETTFHSSLCFAVPSQPSPMHRNPWRHSYTHNTSLYFSILKTFVLDCLFFSITSVLTAFCHFADARGLTGCETNMSNSQHMVAWAEGRNSMRTDFINASLEMCR